nr:hypothetical protein Q903MT_gene627 [Picea sitchensis]
MKLYDDNPHMRVPSPSPQSTDTRFTWMLLETYMLPTNPSTSTRPISRHATRLPPIPPPSVMR